jgi:hypothetical protein
VHSHIDARNSTLALLIDWLIYLHAWQHLKGPSAYRASDIAFRAALTGNPLGV